MGVLIFVIFSILLFYISYLYTIFKYTNLSNNIGNKFYYGWWITNISLTIISAICFTLPQNRSSFYIGMIAIFFQIFLYYLLDVNFDIPNEIIRCTINNQECGFKFSEINNKMIPLPEVQTLPNSSKQDIEEVETPVKQTSWAPACGNNTSYGNTSRKHRHLL